MFFGCMITTPTDTDNVSKIKDHGRFLRALDKEAVSCPQHEHDQYTPNAVTGPLFS